MRNSFFFAFFCDLNIARIARNESFPPLKNKTLTSLSLSPINTIGNIMIAASTEDGGSFRNFYTCASLLRVPPLQCQQISHLNISINKFKPL